MYTYYLVFYCTSNTSTFSTLNYHIFIDFSLNLTCDSCNPTTSDILTANSSHLGPQTQTHQVQTSQVHSPRYEVIYELGRVFSDDLRISRRREIPGTSLQSGSV